MKPEGKVEVSVLVCQLWYNKCKVMDRVISWIEVKASWCNRGFSSRYRARPQWSSSCTIAYINYYLLFVLCLKFKRSAREVASFRLWWKFRYVVVFELKSKLRNFNVKNNVSSENEKKKKKISIDIQCFVSTITIFKTLDLQKNFITRMHLFLIYMQ